VKFGFKKFVPKFRKLRFVTSTINSHITQQYKSLNNILGKFNYEKYERNFQQSQEKLEP